MSLFQCRTECHAENEGQNLWDLKLLKKDEISPLLVKNYKIRINKDFVPVDPLVLSCYIYLCKKKPMQNITIIWIMNLAPYSIDTIRRRRTS